MPFNIPVGVKSQNNPTLTAAICAQYLQLAPCLAWGRLRRQSQNIWAAGPCRKCWWATGRSWTYPYKPTHNSSTIAFNVFSWSRTILYRLRLKLHKNGIALYLNSGVMTGSGLISAFSYLLDPDLIRIIHAIPDPGGRELCGSRSEKLDKTRMIVSYR